MFNLDTLHTHNFNWQDRSHKVTYCFSYGNNPEKKLGANHIWLVVNLDTCVLKISKSLSILKQPKEIIEKVVEREVKDYLSNEVLEQL
jgi:hypothetical protein